MKYKSVATDWAVAMQGSTNGVVQKIKNVFLDCVSNHCMIHWGALVVKQLTQENNQWWSLEIDLDDVIKIVSFIRAHSKKHKMFSELCKKTFVLNLISSAMDWAALYRRDNPLELLAIIELQSDLLQKAEFRTINYCTLYFGHHFSAFLITKILVKSDSVVVTCQETTFVSKDFLLLSKLNKKEKLNQGCWSRKIIFM